MEQLGQYKRIEYPSTRSTDTRYNVITLSRPTLDYVQSSVQYQSISALGPQAERDTYWHL
jgi:hypothetical protein